MIILQDPVKNANFFVNFPSPPFSPLSPSSTDESIFLDNEFKKIKNLKKVKKERREKKKKLNLREIELLIKKKKDLEMGIYK